MAWYNFNKKKKKPMGNMDQMFHDSIAIQNLLNGQGITTNQEARDRDYVEQGYQLSPIVFSIIRQTYNAAGSVPWKIYKKDKNGKKTEIPNRMLEHLMYRPNKWMSWNYMIKELVMFYMLQGDMYLWAPQPEQAQDDPTMRIARPVSLWPLPSQHVQIHADQEMGISGYSLDYYSNGSNIEILPQDVLHIKVPNPEYDEDASFLYGQSPLRALRRSIEVNNRSIDTSQAYIENQGARGILYQKNMDFGELDEKQVDRLQRNWENRRGGVPNANKVAVSNGEYGFVNLMNTAADIELLEQYDVSKLDICNAYNFPPLLVGIGTGTYANQNEAKKAFWNDSIIPILSELRDGLNVWLAPHFGENICVDFDLSGVHAIQEDMLMRGKAITSFAGMITINEAREMANLPPVSSTGDVSGDSMYVGFTQSVNKDEEDDSDTE